MGKRVAELNKRIKAKLKELQDDKEDRERARRIIHRVDATVAELSDELVNVRKRIKRRRALIAEVRDDLGELEAKTPDEDTPEEQELRARLDELTGEYEEAIATRDRILGRLDRLQDKRADARKALEKAFAESNEDREALQRFRKRRKLALEARERNDRPSPNFDWAEFYCNDGTPFPEGSKPAIKHWCETVGEPLRAKYGSVHINSAFRHRAYNARIGGEDASVHIYDYPGRNFKAVAVDFRCAKGSPADWFMFTAGKADGRGRYNTFHHADNRNRIGWPDASWVG